MVSNMLVTERQKVYVGSNPVVGTVLPIFITPNDTGCCDQDHVQTVVLYSCCCCMAQLRNKYTIGECN